MTDAARLKRAKLLVRLRVIEHRRAAALLRASLEREVNAAQLAGRTAKLAQSYATRSDAGSGQELAAHAALARQTYIIHAEAETGIAAARRASEPCRAEEQAARRRRGKTEEYRETLSRALRAERVGASDQKRKSFWHES